MHLKFVKHSTTFYKLVDSARLCGEWLREWLNENNLCFPWLAQRLRRIMHGVAVKSVDHLCHLLQHLVINVQEQFVNRCLRVYCTYLLTYKQATFGD